MIKILYKIIHFENAENHSASVSNSFLFIWIIVSVVQFLVVYFLFSRISNTNYARSIFALIVIVLSGAAYYLVKVKFVTVFCQKGYDRDFYDFGKYNNVLKPLVALGLIAIVVVVGKVLLMIDELK